MFLEQLVYTNLSTFPLFFSRQHKKQEKKYGEIDERNKIKINSSYGSEKNVEI